MPAASAPLALWNGPTDVDREHVAVWKWSATAYYLEWYDAGQHVESEGPMTFGEARTRVHERFMDASKRPFIGEATVIRNVPYSSVWPGSRGGHDGRAHLVATTDLQEGRLRVPKGAVFCRRKFWDTRNVTESDLRWVRRCPECDRRAQKLGVAWTMEVRP